MPTSGTRIRRTGILDIKNGKACDPELNHTSGHNDDDVGLKNIIKIDFVSSPPGQANATSNNDYYQ